MFLYLCIKAKWWPVACQWLNVFPPDLWRKFLSVADSFHLREVASQVGSLGGSLVKAGGDAAELYSSVAAYMNRAPAAGCATGLHSASRPAAAMVWQPGTSTRQRWFWHSRDTVTQVAVCSNLELLCQLRHWSNNDIMLPCSWLGCKTELVGMSC